MAVFENLHDVGVALSEYLRRNMTPTISDIVAAPPNENPTAAAEAVRVSLMWVTPQPTHRNDGWRVGDDGVNRPPPVSLSGFYLVTTYGTTDTGEPSQAINRLGQVLQIFETGSILDLPLPDDPATVAIDPTPGTGRMTVVHVPAAADLMEKIYTPLQMRHRPWALFEVGPIQLDRLDQPQPGPDTVQPGGARLVDVTPVAAPIITRITPQVVRAGGRIRLDTVEAATAATLRIGDTLITITAAPVPPLETAPVDEFGALFATCPAGFAIGQIDVVLRGPRQLSEPQSLTVVPAITPGLDAPVAPLLPGVDLVLTGGNLATAARVFLWSDAGIQAPDDVTDLAPDAIADAAVTLSAASLAAAGLRPQVYRVALRMASGQLTPFVLLQVAS